MNISIDKIDTIVERTGVGYVDAKDALEKNNYDLVESLVYLERENKIKNKSKHKKDISKIKYLIKDLCSYKFIVTKNNNVVIDLPMIFTLFFAILTTPIFLLSILIAFLTNHTFSIQKQNERTIQKQNVKNDNLDNNDTEKSHVSLKKDTI